MMLWTFLSYGSLQEMTQAGEWALSVALRARWRQSTRSFSSRRLRNRIYFLCCLSPQSPAWARVQLRFAVHLTVLHPVLLVVMRISYLCVIPLQKTSYILIFFFFFPRILLEEKSGKKCHFFLSRNFLTQSCVVVFARSLCCMSLELKCRMQITSSCFGRHDVCCCPSPSI